MVRNVQKICIIWLVPFSFSPIIPLHWVKWWEMHKSCKFYWFLFLSHQITHLHEVRWRGICLIESFPSNHLHGARWLEMYKSRLFFIGPFPFLTKMVIYDFHCMEWLGEWESVKIFQKFNLLIGSSPFLTKSHH